MSDSDSQTSIALGLDAIFAAQQDNNQRGNKQHQPISPDSNQQTVQRVDIALIKPSPYQLRHTFSERELNELAQNIQQHGILQPLTIRKNSGQFELIAGERRLRAAKIAGLKTVPVLCCEVNDETAMAFACIENLQRENLNPIEEARAYQRLLTQFQLTHEGIAKCMGKSRATITNFLRLLKLNTEVRHMIEVGDIELSHAKVLGVLSESLQSQAAKLIKEKGLSVRETEKLVNRLKPNQSERFLDKSDNKYIDADLLARIKHLEQDMGRVLSQKVAIKLNATGKGRMIIPVSNLDEVELLLLSLKKAYS